MSITKLTALLRHGAGRDTNHRLDKADDLDPVLWDTVSGGESDPGGLGPIGVNVPIGRGGFRLF